MHHISSSKQQVLSKLVKKIPLHSFSAADSKCRVTVGWCFTASSSYVTSFSWPTSHFSYFLFHFNDIGSLCSAPFPSSVFLILFPFNLFSFHTRAFYLVSFYFTSSQLSVCSSPFEPISFFSPWIFTTWFSILASKGNYLYMMDLSQKHLLSCLSLCVLFGTTHILNNTSKIRHVSLMCQRLYSK